MHWIGDRNIAVTFGGVIFNPGKFVYVDSDRIIVPTERLVT